MRVCIELQSAYVLWRLTRFLPESLKSGSELCRGQYDALNISPIHDHLYESHKNELIDQKQTWLPGEKEISPKAASRENCSLMLLVVKHSIKPEGAVSVSPALEQGSDAKF